MISILTGDKYFLKWLHIQKHTVYVFEWGGCMFLNDMVTEHVFELSGATSNVSAESHTLKSIKKPTAPPLQSCRYRLCSIGG